MKIEKGMVVEPIQNKNDATSNDMVAVMISGSQVLNNVLPESGFVRLSQILGNKRKGIPPIIPVGRSTWWAGVKSGRFPKPIKLSARCTCWNVADIRTFIEKVIRS